MVKFILIALLMVSGAMSLWFLVNGSLESWDYLSLNKNVPAQIKEIEIKELSPSKFALIASYSFNHGEQNYEGETEFKTVHLLNRFAAESEVKKLKTEKWTVWLSSRKPSFSSLEKKSPYKNLIYGFISLSVFIYFLYIFQSKAQENMVDA